MDHYNLCHHTLGLNTILVSHHHRDHIGGLPIFEKAAADAGTQLRIIASDETKSGEKDDFLTITEVIEKKSNALQI